MYFFVHINIHNRDIYQRRFRYSHSEKYQGDSMTNDEQLLLHFIYHYYLCFITGISSGYIHKLYIRVEKLRSLCAHHVEIALVGFYVSDIVANIFLSKRTAKVCSLTWQCDLHAEFMLYSLSTRRTPCSRNLHIYVITIISGQRVCAPFIRGDFFSF